MTQVKGAAGVSTVKSDSEPPHIRPFPAISEECVSPRVKEVKGPCQVSRKGTSKRVFKYGSCKKCMVSMKPVVHATGQWAGTCILRCSRWWAQSHGKRECWYHEKFTGDVSSLPKEIRSALQLE